MHPNEPIRVTLRRPELHALLTRHRPLDVVVLLDLTIRAHLRTGRLWTTAEKLAAELGLSERLVLDTIDRLVERELLSRLPAKAPLLALEIGALLVRDGEAPSNLPLEPTPV